MRRVTREVWGHLHLKLCTPVALVAEQEIRAAADIAIENGTSMVRATSSGISGAFDPWGRVLGVTDHFSGARTLVSEVPLAGVRTVYSYTGDLFAWLCILGLMAAIATAIQARK